MLHENERGEGVVGVRTVRNQSTEIFNDRDSERGSNKREKKNRRKINPLFHLSLLREDSLLVQCRLRYIGRQRSLVGDRSGIQKRHKIKRNSKMVGSIAESKHAYGLSWDEKECVCVWSVKRRYVV